MTNCFEFIRNSHFLKIFINNISNFTIIFIGLNVMKNYTIKDNKEN